MYSDRSSQCAVEESLGHDRGFRTYKSCLIFLLRFYRLVKFGSIYCFIFILIYFVVIHMLNIYIMIITYMLSKITTTKSVKFVRILFHMHAINVVLKVQIYPLLHLQYYLFTKDFFIFFLL